MLNLDGARCAVSVRRDASNVLFSDSKLVHTTLWLIAHF